jgi:co-chaperonin GroES (HSP10)
MFKPVNRHILIELDNDADDKSAKILLPDDYKPVKEKYTVATVLGLSEDLNFNLKVDNKIIIDQSMIEEIAVNHTTYSIILENYVVGIIDL